MAFLKDGLRAVGGFDEKFKIAGDDVDICWRIQQCNLWLAFSPAAKVWHQRRNSIRAYWRQQVEYGKAEAILQKKWPHKYNDIGHIPWKGRIYGKGLTKSVGWRNWRIYYGTGGSAPFQSLYGNRATFLQSLPLIPEWYLVNLALSVLSILGLLWKPLLLALPLLLVTVGFPLINVIKSVAEASFTIKPLSLFDQLKMRFLTGLLYVIQPMARLYGRFLNGLTPWRWQKTLYYAFPRPQKYEIWSENWKAPDKWLQIIKTAIEKKGAVAKAGGDFDHWDLEIRGGLFGAIRSQMAIEEHGAGKQFLRLRTWVTVSPIGISLILLFAFLSILAAIDQVWLVAALLALFAVGLAVRIYHNCAVATGVCLQALQDKKALVKDDTKVSKVFIMRKKVKAGNEFVKFDRRQNKNQNYSGPERRSGIDRREGFAAASSQKKQDSGL
jgi:hypothetical protein